MQLSNKVAFDRLANVCNLSLLFGEWGDVVTLLLKKRDEIEQEPLLRRQRLLFPRFHVK
jgi:hypothetical protein